MANTPDPSVNYPGDKYVGDPEFHERHFTDTTGHPPPLYMEDAFTKQARTLADQSIEDAAKPSTPQRAGTEPGETEFSWGKGLMPPLSKTDGPTQIEEMKAIMRTNPADPGASHLDRYADWIRE